jgi:hypothetical protein
MRAIRSKIALGLFYFATTTLLASACTSEATGPSQPDDSVGMVPVDSVVAHGNRMN